MNDIHTCSYSCERPECIKAQRDELAARLEAQMDQASGNAEYLAYLEAAVDDAGFVIKHDGGTLGNSNFRLEPKTQPASAQEAVAWQVGDEFYPSESLAIEAIQQWGPSGAIAIPLYAAAPVTAAPGLPAAVALCANSEPQPTPEGWEKYWDSTTTAPGIDLEQFREAVTYWRDTALQDMQYQNGPLHEQANEGQRLLDLIDAGPKGDD